MTERIKHIAGPRAVSPTRRERDILSFLRDKKGSGPITPKMIALHLGMLHQNVNHLLQRMEAKGLVRKSGIEIVE